MYESVFLDDEEIERLVVQLRLLMPYEKAIMKRLSNNKESLTVLDVGCNNGTKSVALFSEDNIKKVIGLEFNRDLTQKATEKYGSNRFSFYECDVDSEDFAEKLSGIMIENNIESFDIVYLSFVLMHLKNPKSTLKVLKKFMSSDGVLVAVEPNDSISSLVSDKSFLLDEFLALLASDPYAGNRHSGGELPKILLDCGYENITVENDLISAKGAELLKKRDIFETFFSYFPKDSALLSENDPENPLYKKWDIWLTEKYDLLKQTIIGEKSKISMGVSIISSKRGGF